MLDPENVFVNTVLSFSYEEAHSEINFWNREVSEGLLRFMSVLSAGTRVLS